MKTCPCEYRHFMDELPIDVSPSIETVLFKLCYHAAPTISGIKPSSLVVLKGSCARHFVKHERDIKRIMPLDIEILHKDEKRVSLLVFNSDTLLTHISQAENMNYLTSLGYPAYNLATVLGRLKSQFSSGCPSEIGVFLGYPVDDVIAFQSKCEKPLFIGYWSVYNDVQGAKQIFEQFDNARAHIGQIFRSGTSPSSYLQSITLN